MSTQLGSTAKGTSGAVGYSTTSYNQYARRLTMPSGGPWSVSRAGSYGARFGSGSDARIVVWDADTGAVLGKSATFTPSLAAHNPILTFGDSVKMEHDLETPITVAGGKKVLVGWAWDVGGAASGMMYDFTNGVTDYERRRTTWPGSMSGAVTSDGAVPGWLFYDPANTLPGAPTLSSPADGSRQTTATPSFAFTHNDVDADPCASYDLQVSTDNTFASVTHWNDADDTTGIVGDNITRTYAGTALTRGVTYYWRCRTNDGTGDGTWSATRSFTYNALPTATKDSPTASTLAYVHNLGDLALWTSGGSHAKPRFKFTPSDADGDTLTKYRIRIYDAASGGSTVWDSGEVASTMTSGVQKTVDGSTGLVNGTQYWWTVMVYDGYEWMSESSRTAFKVRWAQGLYEFNATASSTNWAFSNGTTAKYVAIIFRSADTSGGDSATGKTAWQSAIASVAVKAYVQILVRLSTDTAGTPSTLADMTFQYYGTPSTPDGWTAS